MSTLHGLPRLNLRPPLLRIPVVTEETAEHSIDDAAASAALIQEDLHWTDGYWTAKVIKSEEGEGWAVSMTLEDQDEPTLVGPWTMGRNKKDPKPLNLSAFTTLVKTANEIIMRHEQQAHAALHKSTKVAIPNGRIRVDFDIVPDEFEPYAELSAHDDDGEELAQIRVPANYRFNHDTASAWVASGMGRIDGGEDS